MRKRSRLLAAFLTSLALGWTTAARAADPVVPNHTPHDSNLRTTPEVEVIKRVRDAVVNIHSERTALGAVTEDFFSFQTSQHRVNGMGTGIVIDARGYIVTNHHVVEEVNTIRVRLADGTVVGARIVARDAENDLALLKIETSHVLPVMPLGTSSDLMVGEKVIAVGNAYGYDHTVTSGIISAINRDVTLNKEVSYKALIQTDAAINPGNSGGPLLNVHGDLIGVNVAIRAGAQNIGFAIPVDTMIRVAASMLAKKGGGAAHGMVVRDDVRAMGEDGFVRTVVVERVNPDSSAAKAGVRPGDVLVKVGTTPILSSLDLERAMLDMTSGDHVPVVFVHDTKEQRAELAVEVVKTVSLTGDPVWRRLGLRLQTINAENVTRTHPQLHGGLYIADVRSDSTASKVGLQRGDILIGLHQWETLDLNSVQWVLNNPDLATFNPIKFYILRAGQIHRGTILAAD